MFFVALILFILVKQTNQCMRTVDHQGTTIPPPNPKTTTLFAQQTTARPSDTTANPAITTTTTMATTTTTVDTAVYSCPVDPNPARVWILSEPSATTERLCFAAYTFDRPELYNWMQLTPSCTRSDIGGIVAPMRSEQERLAIKAAVDAAPTEEKNTWPAGDLSIYLGLKDTATSNTMPGKYEWQIDNSIIGANDYTNWIPGEPTRMTFPNGICVSTRLSDYKWREIDCGPGDHAATTIGLVCAKQPIKN